MITLQDGTVIETPKEGLSMAGCFAGRDDIVSVEIQRGVKIIRKDSFARCVNLKHVSLPQGLKAIESDAFAGCTSLEEINLPESLLTIEAGALSGTAIRQIEIPANVVKIKARTFASCRNLSRFVVPNVKADAFDFSALDGCEIEEFECSEELKRKYERYRLATDWRAHMSIRSREELSSLDLLINDNLLVLPIIWHLYDKQCLCGPYYTTRQAFDGLMEHIDMVDDKEMFVKNLIFSESSGHSFYSDSLWKSNVIGYTLKGLTPGNPFFLVKTNVWHSSSFHESVTLFGIFAKESQARTCCRKHGRFDGYPLSQDKPEIIALEQNEARFIADILVDRYDEYSVF